MSQNPPLPSLDALVQQFIVLPEETRNKGLKIFAERFPEEGKELLAYFDQHKGLKYEAQGYETWLRTFGPHTFTGSFAPFHHDFWKWYWPIAFKLRNGETLDPNDLVALLPWSRDTGKCVSEGTEVLYEDGVRRPIECVNAGDRLLSVDQATGRSVTDIVRQVFRSGLQECFRLKTRTGKYLDLTGAHRLWGFDGWKPVSEMRVGDRVAVPRRTLPKPYSARSDAEVKLVAYMIAEGCTVGHANSRGVTCSASFTNADRIIVTDFKVAAAGMGFGVNQVRHGTQGGSYRAHITYNLIGAQQWLRDTGLSGKGAHQKRVPAWMFGLPERQRWLFLAAMIDTDGWIDRRDGINITLANKPLIEDLVYLFMSVGVVTSIYWKPNKCRGAWQLTVDNECANRCAVYLPLILKNEKMQAAAKRACHSLLDTYPMSVGRNLAAGVNRAIRNAGGPHLSAGPYPRITRAKIQRALAIKDIARLMWLEQAEVFWDEVVSIEPIGTRETYDLEMASPSHNFIANGIVSHNSSHSEWSAIAEGALVRRGYVLWVSGKQAQAEEHVVSIRDRIESEQIGKMYPWLAKPKVGEHGNKFGWGQKFLMTGETRSGFGWAVRPAGLGEALRGGKILDMRPTLIVLSDVDDIGDSIAVVEGKEQMIARSVLPMGDASTRIIFDQNPIHQNSVMNRILTRTSSVLAVRRVIGSSSGGPIPAFHDDLVIEFEQTEHGPRHIIKAGTPTWADMSVVKCQVFLDRSGIDAFKAEYMHDLTANDEERVLPEYDDRVTRAHVITWSQFEQMFGQRRIPPDWVCEAGLDIGYSTGHRSGWTFLTTAPQWCKLAGSRFRYRGRSFQAVGIDDQSIAIKASLWEGEQLQREYMSHEKLGERLVLSSKHGWHFQPCDSAKTAGLAQWRHFLTCDHHRPHPFHRDEKTPDGLWKIGCPSWFDIVADDQFFSPTDDYGLKRHRDGAYNWKRRKVKVTESGLTVDEPMKMDDDENDSTRMLLAGVPFGAMQSMSETQKIQALIPPAYQAAQMQKEGVHPNQIAVTNALATILAKQTMHGSSKQTVTDEFGNVRA